MTRADHPAGLRRRRAAAALLAAFAAFAAASVPGRAQAGPPAVGDMAPDSLGRTLDGETLHLSDLRGTVVVVSFWASWCPHCIDEMPVLDRLQAGAGASGVRVIAVNVESREVFRRVTQRLAPMNLHLQITHDFSEAARGQWDVHGLPHLFIVGRDGRVIGAHLGYSSDQLPAIADEVVRAIAAGR